MNDKNPEAPQQNADVLSIDARRERSDLVYRVTNKGAKPIWAFLLVPTLADGKLTFAKDAAWLESEGDLLLVRKVDTPVPDDVKAERYDSGAIRLAPGASHEGRIQLGDEVEVRGPYQRASTRMKVSRVVLEVGWLPVREGQASQDASWEGKPFAYLRSEVEPGGQQLARSPVITW